MDYSLIKRPVWAEINLDCIEHNFNEVKKTVVEDTLIAAVIKSDAYGLGAVEISSVFKECGADYFAVATLSEAIQLRKRHSEIPILILGYTPNGLIKEVIEYDIHQTLYTLDQAKVFNDIAMSMGKKIKVHLNIESGMNRLGFKSSKESVDEIVYIHEKLTMLVIEGMFTHFAVADEKDKSFTRRQVERYMFMSDELEKKGIDIPVKHVSNSAGIIDLPEYNFNMVRAGIILYGCYPSDDVDHKKVVLKPVVNLRAEISHVKDVPKGEGISYGLIYKTDSPKKIATVPIGYGDGFSRNLSGKGGVLVKGKYAPIVGRICMDQCMIDVTGIDVVQGDVVTIYGEDEDNSISIDSVAKSLGTINYEVLCMLNKRIPRIYMKNNKIIKVKDYILME